MFNWLKYQKVYYIFSTILIVATIAGFVIYGLNLGIDFQGGSELRVRYEKEAPTVEVVQQQLSSFSWEQLNVRSAGEKEVVIQVKQQNISEQQKQKVVNSLAQLGNLQEESAGFESISPVIGKALKTKTKTVVILSILAILFYVSIAFRQISHPLPSWQYGLAALIALFHDVLLVLGVFVALGITLGVEINIPIITALLIVFGYSVNDSVVVFDRIRENILRGSGQEFDEVVNKSLSQTIVRSANTSLTTLFVLVALFLFGGTSLKYFALSLVVGILAGTYSSLFLASPMLVSWWRKKFNR